MSPVRGQMIETVQSIHIGAVLDVEKRKQRNDELDMHEIDLQYQMPVEGTSGDLTSTWASIEIDFEWEFHYAPGNRENDLGVPQFTYGAVAGPDRIPVALLACVTEWKIDEDTKAINGCFLSAVAYGPARPIKCQLHVTFQGYAMSRDDFSDASDLETGDDT